MGYGLPLILSCMLMHAYRQISSNDIRCVSRVTGITGRRLPSYYNPLILNLDQRNLAKVPACVKEDKKYTTVQLDFNRITDIGDNDFNGCTNLEKVSLVGNRVKYISPSAFVGTRLKHLLVQLNKLTCIPNLASVSSTLISLYIQHNLLGECNTRTRYTFSFLNLQTLSIGYNKLTELPNIFYHSKMLRTLSIAHNLITRLADLRLSFPKLLKEEFLLSKNPIICDCSSMWIKEFIKPHILPEFSCNRLGPFPDVSWSNVTLSDLTDLCTLGSTLGNIYI